MGNFNDISSLFVEVSHQYICYRSARRAGAALHTRFVLLARAAALALLPQDWKTNNLSRSILRLWQFSTFIYFY